MKNLDKQDVTSKIGAIHNIEGRTAFRWNVYKVNHTKKRKKNQTTFKHNLNAISIESVIIQQPLKTGLLELSSPSLSMFFIVIYLFNQSWCHV